MEPGADAVRRLDRIHPTARWAWYEKEECFALLELYPASELESIAYEPWGRRGPVFGASFDSDRFHPAWLANFSIEDVKSHAFVPVVKRWLTSMRERMIRSAAREAQRFEDNIHNIAGEQGERMYWQGQRSCESPIMVPYKFLTQEEKDQLRGDNMPDVKQSFMPNI